MSQTYHLHTRARKHSLQPHSLAQAQTKNRPRQTAASDVYSGADAPTHAQLTGKTSRIATLFGKSSTVPSGAGTPPTPHSTRVTPKPNA